MTRAAILCPGPSLPTTWFDRKPEEHYDCVIGVNRAILHDLCDWWVAGDWMIFKDVPATPRIGYCTQKIVIGMIDAKTLIPPLRQPDVYKTVAWEELKIRHRFSFLCALGLAHHLGMTSVSVFGDDKKGLMDFDGHAPRTANRSESRWEDEKQATATVSGQMLAAGVAVSWMRRAG